VGGADAHQVVFPCGDDVEELDLRRAAPQFRRDHPQDLPERVRHGEFFEPGCVARVGESDRGQAHITAAAAEHTRHRLDYLQGLLGVGEIDEQH
jgi:hypothetical protein